MPLWSAAALLKTVATVPFWNLLSVSSLLNCGTFRPISPNVGIFRVFLRIICCKMHTPVPPSHGQLHFSKLGCFLHSLRQRWGVLMGDSYPCRAVPCCHGSDQFPRAAERVAAVLWQAGGGTPAAKSVSDSLAYRPRERKKKRFPLSPNTSWRSPSQAETYPENVSRQWRLFDNKKSSAFRAVSPASFPCSCMSRCAITVISTGYESRVAVIVCSYLPTWWNYDSNASRFVRCFHGGMHVREEVRSTRIPLPTLRNIWSSRSNDIGFTEQKATKHSHTDGGTDTLREQSKTLCGALAVRRRSLESSPSVCRVGGRRTSTSLHGGMRRRDAPILAWLARDLTQSSLPSICDAGSCIREGTRTKGRGELYQRKRGCRIRRPVVPPLQSTGGGPLGLTLPRLKDTDCSLMKKRRLCHDDDVARQSNDGSLSSHNNERGEKTSDGESGRAGRSGTCLPEEAQKGARSQEDEEGITTEASKLYNAAAAAASAALQSMSHAEILMGEAAKAAAAAHAMQAGKSSTRQRLPQGGLPTAQAAESEHGLLQYQVGAAAPSRRHATGEAYARTGIAVQPTRRDLWLLSLTSSLPFVGFGLVDNFVMIVAGDMFDTTLCVAVGLSTMAAAALGNWISDLMGLWLGSTIERLSSKALLIPKPCLSKEEMESPLCRRYYSLGTGLGISVGCLLGMAPLLFLDTKEGERLKQQREQAKTLHTDVAEAIAAYLRAERVVIYLLDRNEKAFHTEINGHPVQIPLDAGIPGRVYATGLLVNWRPSFQDDTAGPSDAGASETTATDGNASARERRGAAGALSPLCIGGSALPQPADLLPCCPRADRVAAAAEAAAQDDGSVMPVPTHHEVATSASSANSSSAIPAVEGPPTAPLGAAPASCPVTTAAARASPTAAVAPAAAASPIEAATSRSVAATAAASSIPSGQTLVAVAMSQDKKHEAKEDGVPLAATEGRAFETEKSTLRATAGAASVTVASVASDSHKPTAPVSPHVREVRDERRGDTAGPLQQWAKTMLQQKLFYAWCGENTPTNGQVQLTDTTVKRNEHQDSGRDASGKPVSSSLVIAQGDRSCNVEIKPISGPLVTTEDDCSYKAQKTISVRNLFSPQCSESQDEGRSSGVATNDIHATVSPIIGGPSATSTSNGSSEDGTARVQRGALEAGEKRLENTVRMADGRTRTSYKTFADATTTAADDALASLIVSPGASAKEEGNCLQTESQNHAAYRWLPSYVNGEGSNNAAPRRVGKSLNTPDVMQVVAAEAAAVADAATALDNFAGVAGASNNKIRGLYTVIFGRRSVDSAVTTRRAASTGQQEQSSAMQQNTIEAAAIELAPTAAEEVVAVTAETLTAAPGASQGKADAPVFAAAVVAAAEAAATTTQEIKPPLSKGERLLSVTHNAFHSKSNTTTAPDPLSIAAQETVSSIAAAVEAAEKRTSGASIQREISSPATMKTVAAVGEAAAAALVVLRATPDEPATASDITSVRGAAATTVFAAGAERQSPHQPETPEAQETTTGAAASTLTAGAAASTHTAGGTAASTLTAADTPAGGRQDLNAAEERGGLGRYREAPTTDFPINEAAAPRRECQQILGAPIFGFDGDIIGVVEVINPLNRVCFSRKDKEFLLSICPHIAVEVEGRQHLTNILEMCRKQVSSHKKKAKKNDGGKGSGDGNMPSCSSERSGNSSSAADGDTSAGSPADSISLFANKFFA